MSAAEGNAELRRRITSLERQNCRLWVVVLLLGGLTAWNAVGKVRAAPAAAIVLEADQFVLKDPDGRTRGDWLVDQTGAARLVLYDAAGRPIAQIPPALTK